jgi:hypothetical protein
MVVQFEPSQCRIVPPVPTANTSFGPEPQMPQREFSVPLATDDQADPS